MKRFLITFCTLLLCFLIPVLSCRCSSDRHSKQGAEITVSAVDNHVTVLPVVMYDIPLSDAIQLSIIDQCRAFNVDVTLVFAVMEQESDYNPNAVNAAGTCFGLMQIHQCNFQAYKLDEPFNVLENTRVGIQMLSELLEKYEKVELALMAYNCGEAGARRLWVQGIESTSYSRSVLDKQKIIKEGGREREIG